MESKTVQKPAASEKKAKNGALDFVANLAVIISISAACSFLTMKVFYDDPPREEPVHKVVILDSERLSSDYVVSIAKQASDGKIKPAEMIDYSRSFMEKMHSIVSFYLNGGYIVIKRDSVFAVPGDVEDVTSKVKSELEKMGVEF